MSVAEDSALEMGGTPTQIRKVPEEMFRRDDHKKGRLTKLQKLEAAHKVLEERQRSDTEQHQSLSYDPTLITESHDPQAVRQQYRLGLEKRRKPTAEASFISTLSRDNANPSESPAEKTTIMPHVSIHPLRKTPKRRQEGWRIIGHEVLTAKLPEWFDERGSDATFKRISSDPAFHAIRVNDCLDRPRDPRVVPFLPSLRKRYMKLKRFKNGFTIVNRIELKCSTTHLPDKYQQSLAAQVAFRGGNLSDSDSDSESSESEANAEHTNPAPLPSPHCSGTSSIGNPDHATLRQGNANQRKGRKSGKKPPATTSGGCGKEGKCHVKIVIEVSVAQCETHTSTIWQRGTHDELPMPLRKTVLRISPFVRNHIRRLAAHLGTSLSTITTDLVDLRERHPEIPDYRWPTDDQVQHVVESYRRASRLNENQLVAAQVLRDRNPDKLFLHQAKTDTQPFLAGVSGANATDSAIAFMHNGIGLDSTWRALNQSGCPMTHVVTYNENHRMVPVASFLSENIPEVTLITMLQALKERVEERARAIVADGENAVFEGIRTEREKELIIKHARSIVESGRWCPAIAMIDKDRAERNALKEDSGAALPISCRTSYPEMVRGRRKMFEAETNRAAVAADKSKPATNSGPAPGSSARTSAAQTTSDRPTSGEGTAVAMDKETASSADQRPASSTNKQIGTAPSEKREASPAKKKKPKAKTRVVVPSLPHAAKKEVLQNFRDLQRWRPRDGPWSTATDQFNTSIYMICTKYECATTMGTAVVQYFQKNWFQDDWRDMWTDAGLPAGMSRDAMANTNNGIESSFRTFKLVFLGNRHNKRIDRLLAILINDYYPYYALWPPNAARPSADLIRATEWGYNLWKIGHFECISKDDDREIWKITRIATADPGASEEDDQSGVTEIAHSTIIELSNEGHRRCQCRRFRGNGKYCYHLWAMSWLESCGPMVFYEDGVYSNKPKKSRKRRDKKDDALETKKKAACVNPTSVANELLLQDLQIGSEEAFAEDGWESNDQPRAIRSLVPFSKRQPASKFPGQSAYASVKPIKRPRSQIQHDQIAESQSKRRRLSQTDQQREPQSEIDVDHGRQSPRYFLPIHKARTGRDPLGAPIRQAPKKVVQANEVSAPSNDDGGRQAPTKKGSPAKGKATTGTVHQFSINGRLTEVVYPPDCPVGVGLVNSPYARNCYLNAFLQVMLHLPAVTNTVLNLPKGPTRSSAFADVLAALVQQWRRARKAITASILGSEEVNGSKKSAPSNNVFGLQRKQDHCASELMDVFLAMCSGKDPHDHIQLLQWIPADVFGIGTTITYRCSTCGQPQDSITENVPQIVLNVPADKRRSFVELVSDYFASTTETHPRRRKHSGSSQQICPEPDMSCQRTISNPPPYIIFKLSRDDELLAEMDPTSNYAASKGTKLFREINLTPFSDEGVTDLRYACVAAIQHTGSASGHGHYVADVQTIQGWYRFDDHDVRSLASNPATGLAFRTRQTYQSTEVEYCTHPLLLVYQMKQRKDITLEDLNDNRLPSVDLEQTAKLPEFMQGYDADLWANAVRLIKGPFLTDEEVLAYYARFQKAPGPGTNDFAAFETRTKIDGVDLKGPIHPHSAFRFKPDIDCDNRIIASWMDLLQAAVPEGTVIFVDGPFFERMGKGDQEVGKLTRRFRNADIFQKHGTVREIVFPVHVPGHWAAGVIDIQQRQAMLLDSLPNALSMSIFESAVRRFLLILFMQEKAAGRVDDVSEEPTWHFLPGTRNLEGFVPKQSDGSSCGWIAMRYMEVVVAQDDLPNQANCGLEGAAWSNAEGNRLRIDIAWKLKTGTRGTSARCAIVVGDDDEPADMSAAADGKGKGRKIRLTLKRKK